MHYVAIVEGEEREVEIVEVAPDTYQITMGERRLEVDVQPISETQLSALVGNTAYNIEFENDVEGGLNMLVRGHVLHTEVVDLRKMRLRKAQGQSGVASGPLEIRSPMPGKIVAVLVKEGDAVKQGQGVVVVEAMKMENELRAPREGVVKKLSAQEGSAVDGGAVLAIIE